MTDVPQATNSPLPSLVPQTTSRKVIAHPTMSTVTVTLSSGLVVGLPENVSAALSGSDLASHVFVVDSFLISKYVSFLPACPYLTSSWCISRQQGPAFIWQRKVPAGIRSRAALSLCGCRGFLPAMKMCIAFSISSYRYRRISN